MAALPFVGSVLPGTRQVKSVALLVGYSRQNHHSEGSFGDHVTSMELLVADGRVLHLTPEGSEDDPDAELFWATVGGMGLTGIILRAQIRMTKTETAYFIADTERTSNLDETVAAHSDGSEHNYTYSSAWFDVISPAKAGPLDNLPWFFGNVGAAERIRTEACCDPLKFNAPRLMTVPDIFPSWTMNKLSSWPSEVSLLRHGRTSEERSEPDTVLPAARPYW